MSFELHSRSNYRFATDGIPDLTRCSRSGLIRQYGSIWMKVNLRKAYAVSKVRLLSLEPNLYRVFTSNSSEFVNKTECNQDNFYEYILYAQSCKLSIYSLFMNDLRALLIVSTKCKFAKSKSTTNGMKNLARIHLTFLAAFLRIFLRQQ